MQNDCIAHNNNNNNSDTLYAKQRNMMLKTNMWFIYCISCFNALLLLPQMQQLQNCIRFQGPKINLPIRNNLTLMRAINYAFRDRMLWFQCIKAVSQHVDLFHSIMYNRQHAFLMKRFDILKRSMLRIQIGSCNLYGTCVCDIWEIYWYNHWYLKVSITSSLLLQINWFTFGYYFFDICTFHHLNKVVIL